MNLVNNKVQLIGRIGQAPEISNYDGGKKRARFSVATTDTYKDANGMNVNEVQWHNLVAWGRVADVVEKQLAKGTEVSVEGKLVHRNYTGKDGIKKYVTEVVVAEVLLLNNKGSQQE